MGRESNKKRRQSNAATAREKAAAARELQQRAEQRRRALTVLTAVVVVVVVLAVIAVVALTHKKKSSNDRNTASASVVTAVTKMPDASLTTIGEGNVVTLPAPVSGEPALTSGGKPELLYIGAEFCPYCAIERWSLAVALSKFGTLSGIGEVRSGVDDGNFASLDFNKTSFTSKYLVFTPIEAQDRNRNPLEKVPSADNVLWNKLTNNRPGFPFVDFGNKSALTVKVPLDPTVLGTLNQQQVAAQLSNLSGKIAQTIGGGANDDIAAICMMTNNQPSSVCSSSVIQGLESKIG